MCGFTVISSRLTWIHSVQNLIQLVEGGLHPPNEKKDVRINYLFLKTYISFPNNFLPMYDYKNNITVYSCLIITYSFGEGPHEGSLKSHTEPDINTN